MADTIRELLIGLGFQVDDAQQRKFVSAIEGATLRAKLLGDAIEEMARAAVSAVGQVATQFEQLFYQSQRLGASASSIRAYEYAISQLGGTVEGANSSLDDFGAFLRNTPGAAGAISRSLGIPLKDAADHAKFLLEAQQRLAGMNPAVADRYRDAYHLGDPATLFAGERPEARGFYDPQLGRDSAAGIGGDAVAKAAKFEQAWRGVWARIGTMAEGGESKLFAALTDPMQKFSNWLDKNSDKINGAITKIADAVGNMTTSVVDNFDKVDWSEVSLDITSVANSIADLLKQLAILMNWLINFDKESKQWWIVKFLNAGASGQFGSLPDGDGFFASHGAGVGADDMASGAGGLLSRAWGGVKSFFGGGGKPGAGEKVVGHWWTPERMKYAADRLIKEGGLSEAGAAAGLVARWAAVESPGGPGSVNPLSGAVGIAQGLGDRKAGYMGSFADQVTNAVRELNGPEARAAKMLRNALTPEQGALGGSMFERAEGYNSVTGADAFTGATPAAKTLEAIRGAKEATTGSTSAPGSYKGDAGPSLSRTGWDQDQIWSGINNSLPVGTSVAGAAKMVNSTVNNTVHVHGTDPKSTAAMVGAHLDRTSKDVARNLQGAHQ
jgi:hypothetical protein